MKVMIMLRICRIFLYNGYACVGLIVTLRYMCDEPFYMVIEIDFYTAWQKLLLVSCGVVYSKSSNCIKETCILVCLLDDCGCNTVTAFLFDRIIVMV